MKKLDPVFFEHIYKIKVKNRTADDMLKIENYRDDFIVESYRQALKYSNLNWSI